MSGLDEIRAVSGVASIVRELRKRLPEGVDVSVGVDPCSDAYELRVRYTFFAVERVSGQEMRGLSGEQLRNLFAEKLERACTALRGCIK